MTLINPSSAQWPQDAAAALAPEGYYIIDTGGGVIGFTTDASLTNAVLTKNVSGNLEVSTNMSDPAAVMKLLGGRVLFTSIPAAPPAFSPLSLAPHIWLDASQEAFANNGLIGTATDWSGNARHATQATAANKPTFKTGILNGHPVFAFDPTDYLSFADVLSSLTEAEVFIVYRGNLDTNNVGLWWMGTNDCYNPYSDHGVYEGFGSTTRKTTGSPASVDFSTYNLYNVTSKSGEYTTLFNGTQHFTTATNTVGWTTTPELGRNGVGIALGDGAMLTAGIAEFIIFPNVTAPERASMNSYFASKYALTIA